MCGTKVNKSVQVPINFVALKVLPKQMNETYKICNYQFFFRLNHKKLNETVTINTHFLKEFTIETTVKR
jgi:hypothetical protein